MSVVSRISVPQSFIDTLSDVMLQPPLPQRTFAMMLAAANAAAELAALDRNAWRYGAPNGRAQASDLYDNMLALAQSPLADCVRSVIDLQAPGSGHTVYMPRPVYSAGQFSESARTIGAGQDISLVAQAISAERVEITVRRVAGPAPATGSGGPQPFAIDRFDASRSVHDFMSLVGNHLKFDRDAYIDAAIRDRFDVASDNAVVRPSGITADAAFPVSSETELDLVTLLRAQETLQLLNIPTFSDGLYRACITPKQMRQLQSDPDFQRLAVFENSINPAIARDVARVGQLLIIPSNVLRIDTATVPGAAIQRGFAFGPNAIGYASAGPVEPRVSTNDNYGETLRLIWIAYEGHGVLDSRFVVGIRST